MGHQADSLQAECIGKRESIRSQRVRGGVAPGGQRRLLGIAEAPGNPVRPGRIRPRGATSPAARCATTPASREGAPAVGRTRCAGSANGFRSLQRSVS